MQTVVKKLLNAYADGNIFLQKIPLYNQPY
jgi:hypothetical protein